MSVEPYQQTFQSMSNIQTSEMHPPQMHEMYQGNLPLHQNIIPISGDPLLPIQQPHIEQTIRTSTYSPSIQAIPLQYPGSIRTATTQESSVRSHRVDQKDRHKAITEELKQMLVKKE